MKMIVLPVSPHILIRFHVNEAHLAYAYGRGRITDAYSGISCELFSLYIT